MGQNKKPWKYSSLMLVFWTLIFCGFSLPGVSRGESQSPQSAAGSGSSKEPESKTGDFANLKVFPHDIGRRELIEEMKSFTRALGVRCQHCHVGEEGAPLSSFDFQSDEKSTKEIARQMMRMTREINQQHLQQLGDGRGGIAVSCVTCHHGKALPQSLEQVLEKTIAEKGTPAMVEEYRRLRKQYYGSDAFDFSDKPLVRLAQKWAGQKEPQTALALLLLNRDHHPQSARTHCLLGELYTLLEQTDDAQASLERCVELQPENMSAKKRLESLRGE